MHGIEVEDSDRRRGLLLTTILGDSGAKIVTDGAELTTVSVARSLLTRMPMATVRKVNTTMTRRFVRTQVTNQTGLAFGRIIPFGIGLVIGVAGARSLGKNVIEGARRAFGPPPLTFPRVIEVAVRTAAPCPARRRAERLTGRFKADRLAEEGVLDVMSREVVPLRSGHGLR